MIILGLFAAVCSGVMLEIYARELYAGVLTTPEIASLKERLKADPNNEALKEEARWIDAQLRADNQRNRDRLKWGAYLLLAALIGWVASARWFVALGKAPEPAFLEGKQDRQRPARVAMAVAAA
ncbi:MAG: hypothetical protein NTW86_04660, partial [Candidatus Sumerlaeota bacterium]|nr:hypothetical protein [Candidatus Sumerlaeota bacterium]